MKVQIDKFESLIPKYLIILEYIDQETGFIIGAFNSEAKARSQVNPFWKTFEEYVHCSDGNISSIKYFQKYQSYRIIGGDYFTGCDRYLDRQSMSNGFQTLSIIKCKGIFDFNDFIEFRNSH
jgi:hypothetical protein